MEKTIILFIVLFFFSIRVFGQDMSADDILKQVDDTLDLSHTEAEIEMQVYRENKLQNTYRINLKYQDQNHMLSETLYPPRNKGEKSLHVDNNQWLYLPKINKILRVSQRNTFSNSDFSNMDIMKFRLSEDYKPKLIEIEKLNGIETYKLELTAKTEEAAYAKIIYWIRKSDLYPLQRKYYTLSGNVLKQLVMETKSNIRGGMPDFFIMTDVLEKNKYTILQFISLERDKTFPTTIFRKDSLIKR